MRRALRMATVSDIHLGHRNNPTRRILDNLNNKVNNGPFLSSIDILFLAGDIFDHLLTMDSDDAAQIDLWIAKLLRNCIKYNVVVRILEGTPSHDRKQSISFPKHDEMLQKAKVGEVKMKYVDTLSIEYIEEFDIHVLYVPDEWKPSTQDTLDEVRALMAEMGLEQVDFAIMHGLFEYQLMADIPHIPRHDSIAYHGLVKYLTFIGHIHTFSRNDRIIAQGSFDRLSHGEEEAKGFVRAVVQVNGDFELQFIENEDALKFITVVCTHDEVADSLIEIDRVVKRLPEGSFVRVQARWDNPILTNMNVIKERYPQFWWSSIGKDKEEKTSQVILDHKSVYVPLQINRQNIHSVVQERLGQRKYDGDTIQRCMANLNEIA